MKLLHILDTLYQSRLFTKFLVIGIVLLSLIFILILFLGIKDKQKNRKKEELKDSTKDITFLNRKDENVKEDVTFEVSSLTKNLQDFKKSLEEEIKKENQNIVLKPEEKEKIENADEKKIPVLDQEAIEDTAMVNILIPEDDLEIPKTK